ncbi:hypothetical protein PQX77_000482 [Marasmius sp. AFHP31]|nr:hypothetical protein PQX77_003595 [Marasmius sp. AFHP31]KAK1236278.1 hypothetical protein PQX77_000482 [Marasmius sp. AFHP31]
MQLASHGPRGIPRVSNLISGGQTSRSIHIPAYVRVKPTAPLPNVSTTQRVLSKTRTLLNRFVGHLTTPGLQQVSHASSLAHGARSAAPGRMNTIQQRMSLPVRHALSRPVQPLHFPRGPAVPPRSVAQVGLGTARNFHSGRSVFQNLVDNVPIVGRAFYEADWEINMKRDREAMRKIMHKSKKENKTKEMMKPKSEIKSYTISATEDQTEPSPEEMNKYFDAPVAPEVTTYLLIPLAPTPTSRVPLDPNGSGHPSLLPRSSLMSMHNEHEMHGLRVSSLFSRLDAAKVWENGAICSSYASHADKHGVCTILKVEFVGWNIAQVRGVIGEAGTGWCVLEEEHISRAPDEDDDDLSDASSILSGISSPVGPPPGLFDSPESVTDSFVLPTLDFSSAFIDGSGTQRAESPVLSRTSSTSDIFAADVVEYDDPWSDAEVSETDSLEEVSSVGSRLGFSYDFASRSSSDLEAQYRPREDMFY